MIIAACALFQHEFLNETKLTLAITWAGENNGVSAKCTVVLVGECGNWLSYHFCTNFCRNSLS